MQLRFCFKFMFEFLPWFLPMMDKWTTVSLKPGLSLFLSSSNEILAAERKPKQFVIPKRTVKSLTNSLDQAEGNSQGLKIQLIHFNTQTAMKQGQQAGTKCMRPVGWGLKTKFRYLGSRKRH